ncbi:MAG: 2Fe-2S iron-sulfur cluster binding domain-containing protein [Gammaproteobacteria bacterium]|nr:2Fe-2S iron-sulfur cluster binding domain-containing protein [Gammaproteobacteria bacterium]
MSFNLAYDGECYSIEDGASVLDTLLDQGIEIPHSCKSGVCQSCMVEVVTGTPTEASQTGLKATFKALNYALSCCLVAKEDLGVSLPNAEDSEVPVSIIKMEVLNHNVLRLCLKTKKQLDTIPGQYLSLITSDSLARSYSVANIPEVDGYIELHIRIIPNGRLGAWLLNDARLWMEVKLRGPAGECFYVCEKDEENDFPMVLAGTSTGLAPLYGIVRDALAQGHKGSIDLFHGALQPEDLYLVDELYDLSQQHKNFSYIPCVMKGNDGDFYTCGDIQELVAKHVVNKKDARLYLCGAPDLVNAMKKTAFLSGIASKHIFNDAFLPSK